MLKEIKRFNTCRIKLKRKKCSFYLKIGTFLSSFYVPRLPIIFDGEVFDFYKLEAKTEVLFEINQQTGDDITL